MGCLSRPGTSHGGFSVGWISSWKAADCDDGASPAGLMEEVEDFGEHLPTTGRRLRAFRRAFGRKTGSEPVGLTRGPLGEARDGREGPQIRTGEAVEEGHGDLVPVAVIRRHPLRDPGGLEGAREPRGEVSLEARRSVVRGWTPDRSGARTSSGDRGRDMGPLKSMGTEVRCIRSIEGALFVGRLRHPQKASDRALRELRGGSPEEKAADRATTDPATGNTRQLPDPDRADSIAYPRGQCAASATRRANRPGVGSAHLVPRLEGSTARPAFRVREYLLPREAVTPASSAVGAASAPHGGCSPRLTHSLRSSTLRPARDPRPETPPATRRRPALADGSYSRGQSRNPSFEARLKGRHFRDPGAGEALAPTSRSADRPHSKTTGPR